MTRAFDILFKASWIVAAILLVLIAMIVVGQIAGRIMGLLIPSADELAAFAMAGAIFLGSAQTYRERAHISVDLLISRLPAQLQNFIGIGVQVVMLALSSHLAWFSIEMTIESYTFNDVTNGILRIPLWLPQSFMAAGTLLLSLALAEKLVEMLGAKNALVEVAGSTEAPKVMGE